MFYLDSLTLWKTAIAREFCCWLKLMYPFHKAEFKFSENPEMRENCRVSSGRSRRVLVVCITDCWLCSICLQLTGILKISPGLMLGWAPGLLGSGPQWCWRIFWTPISRSLGISLHFHSIIINCRTFFIKQMQLRLLTTCYFTVSEYMFAFTREIFKKGKKKIRMWQHNEKKLNQSV